MEPPDIENMETPWFPVKIFSLRTTHDRLAGDLDECNRSNRIQQHPLINAIYIMNHPC